MAKQTKKTEKPTLPPQEALYQAISLCRKAGALTMGFDAVEDACVKGKAWLVMTASDASAKTVQRLNYAVGDLVDVITMPLTQDRLADISRKPVAVYAVTDRNLAKLCFDRLTDCGAIKNEEDMKSRRGVLSEGTGVDRNLLPKKTVLRVANTFMRHFF